MHLSSSSLKKSGNYYSPRVEDPVDYYASQSKKRAQDQLSKILEEQRYSRTLVLNDLNFGDDGAFEVADLLYQNKLLEHLEIRGNHISSDAFGHIITNLEGNSYIKAINAEWNDVGSGTIGLDALGKLAEKSKSLEFVDLRHNKLNSRNALQLAKIIRDSTSLKIIDLRWNELGDQAVEVLIEAIKDNPNSALKSVDLAGNGVSQPYIDQINELLLRRSKGQKLSSTQPIENAESREAGGDPKSASKFPGSLYGSQVINKYPDNDEMVIDLRKALASNVELERLLDLETRRNESMREELLRRLEDERRGFNRKEDDLNRQNRELISRVSALTDASEAFVREREQLKSDLRSAEQQLADRTAKLKALEETLISQEHALNVNDDIYKKNVDAIITENRKKIEDLDIRWQNRFEELERKNKILTERNDSLSEEVNRKHEEIIKIKSLHEDDLRNTVLKTREEERFNHSMQIRQLEAQLGSAEERNRSLENELRDRGREFQTKEQRLRDLLVQADEQIKMLKADNNSEADESNRLKTRLEQLVGDLLTRDNQLIRNENELKHLTRLLESEKTQREELRMVLQQRINDLDNQLRNSQTEIYKLRQDVQKAGDMLITKFTNSVYETLSNITTHK